MKKMNTYLEYVEALEQLVKAGKEIVPGRAPACKKTAISCDAPNVLLFSPHPDDECITGALPLRLMRETGMKIINVPVTFGSNADRRPERAAELKNACGFLGWEIFQRTEETDAASPSHFRMLTKADVIKLLKTIRPAALFMPHSKDWNSRHIDTHFLVRNALREMDVSFSCTVIETEFWGAMSDPNLMIEADAELLADLVTAVSFHVREVERNPFHLLLPAWMQDNVRRGSELVGGQGEAAPDFSFATLYRLSRWENGTLLNRAEGNRIVSISDPLTDLFQGEGHGNYY
jgi:LmbE family N-acetylglucosaminyl deacetylase